MSRARRVCLSLALAAGPLLLPGGRAAAAGPAVLLLKAEVGRGADPAVVASVQRQVEAWIKQGGARVEVGQATLTDTAAIAGCELDEPSCAGQITSTVGVDQLVAVTIERTALGHRVRVTRLRAGAPEVVTSFEVAAADGAATDAAIAAGLRGRSSGGADPAPTSGGPSGAGTTGTPAGGAGAIEGGASGAGAGAAGDAAAGTGGLVGPGGPDQAATPGDRPERAGGGVSRRGLQIGGMITGGILAVAGVSFWAKASGLNDEIAAAPTQTVRDLEALVVLEDDAASAASWGNILTVAGVLIGGGSAYWWLRSRGDSPAASAQAWTPFVAPASGGGSIAGVRWGAP